MKPSTFNGKVVWITGASGGLGEALAIRFAEAGARLVLSARREDELNRVAGLCAGAKSVQIAPLDLSLPESMTRTTATVLAQSGAVDVMVHNAGISQRAYAADADYTIDDRIMRTNYLGPVALTKALIPSMRARRRGQFIVITSVLGKFGFPGRSGYCASKHALHGFFDTLRAELTQDNIAVMLVAPGWVKTRISINALTPSGVPQGTMDAGTAAGFSAEYCAARILRAAEAKKPELYLVRGPERAALYLNRFAPAALRRIISRRSL